MIYTSYLANYTNFPDCSYTIAICRRLNSPADEHMLELAPSWKIVSGIKYDGLSEEDYTKEYISQLESLRESGMMDLIVKYLTTQIPYNNVLLLCYEGKGKFCHRHILRDYLNKYYNLGIEEL